MKRKVIFQYTLIGVLFGFLFPLISSFWLIYYRNMPISYGSFVQTQMDNPLLWVINTAPLFLGLFASFAGVRQARVIELNQDLNSEIEEHTATVKQLNFVKGELEVHIDKQLVRLKAAAEVARQAAAIHNLDKLLDGTVDLISDHFNFYHAGIFLIDNLGEYALLRAASSEGGKVMLQNNHKLKIGKVGIVGFVAAKGEPRIALDVGIDAVYFDNPDLPNTRSEIALPLKSKQKIIGVLDVQSRQAEAFNDDDIVILGTLTDQIALAIENARLFEDNQQALRELESQYRQGAQNAWRRQLKNEQVTYIYDRLGVKAAADLSDFKAKTGLNGYTFQLPIVLRGQTLGQISLIREADQPEWSQDEMETIKTTVNQLALSLENARLLEELQYQVEREHLVSEFSSKLWASSDLNTIARTAIQELGRTLNVSDATIALHTFSEDQ